MSSFAVRGIMDIFGVVAFGLMPLRSLNARRALSRNQLRDLFISSQMNCLFYFQPPRRHARLVCSRGEASF